MNWNGMEQAVRTAVAAVLSLAIARVFDVREAYWAPISTIVVVLSTPGAQWTVSWQRFIGTILGSAAGALLAIEFGTRQGAGLLVLGAGILGLGLLCSFFPFDRAAYRFAGIALAVIVLVPRDEPAWVAALHRFFEVSLGIAVGLVMTWVWPEPHRREGK